MDSGNECTLSNFANDTKLCDVVSKLEGRDAIQRDLDRLERWACANLIRFNKAKCKVLHAGRGNPKHKHRLGKEQTESSPEEKDLWVLGDEKLNMTQQCVLTVQMANRALGCIPSSVGSRAREGILPLCSALVRHPPPGVLCPALEPSAPDRHGAVGVGPAEATKMIQGLEPLCCEERLRELGLFSLEKRRLWGDLRAAFQYLKGPARELERDCYGALCTWVYLDIALMKKPIKQLNTSYPVLLPRLQCLQLTRALLQGFQQAVSHD